jgi:hypothetical protein
LIIADVMILTVVALIAQLARIAQCEAPPAFARSAFLSEL